ncbi:MAG: hypothetical protein JWM68_2697 [Verrucomicrobiales bacterium]|nr:hypothetical protein [Verrucomicrobiales bacterium]
MSTVVNVAIHASQFPNQVRRDLLESLRSRQVNHKFHYDSHKQTQQWLKLHQAYSPSRTDSDCAGVYDASFAAVTQRVEQDNAHLIGLGCGGGQKDARLLRLLLERGKSVGYTPVDVSVAMVLVAHQAAMPILAGGNCSPLVCDFLTANDLPENEAFHSSDETERLMTFFGMIPNFEPQVILPKLAGFLRANDHLLFSANLAPGADYAAGVNRILPLYDNGLTRDWLMTFLIDLGVTMQDGTLRFSVEDCPAGSGLKRVEANFIFARATQISIDEETFAFPSGDSIRLFFSYRHTPETINRLLKQHGVSVLDQWITASQEEGVFLCRRS